MRKISVFIFILYICWSCTSFKYQIDLNDLDISIFSSEQGEIKANKSVSGNILSIAGKSYEKGIGTYADSEGYIRLDGKKGKFIAMVGVDDQVDSDSHASVVFYVFTNKGVAFNSGVMKKGDTPKLVNVNLEGITDLYLVTESGSANNVMSHANWVDAVFEVQTPPVILKNNITEERYVLTPPPSLEPRINGAKIVGASPGKPFLFTIATSGERPIEFNAENLPEGLLLDKEKGVITGRCENAGTYFVSLTASNSIGMCRDTIEICMGGNLALTPPMGWNSWYVHATGITQETMEKSARAMYDEGLVNFGYTYVNIDDGWSVKAGSDDPLIGGILRNEDGTIRTNRNFPDMKRLTTYIHDLGMKAGLYSSPGKTTCGGYAGSLGHEATDIQTFADWGFDFLKYDWCSYEHEVQSPVTLRDYQKPYIKIGQLCKEADRDIVLNMCQYGMGEVWKWGEKVGGQSWRTTADIGDTKNLIANMFRIGFFQEQLAQYAGPGGWNDPDYLLFGDIYDWDKKTLKRSPYSASEHYTCMTLWCMMSAPLIFSGDITTLDDFTRNILCNAEVIAVNQDKLGKQGYSIYNKDLIEIWKKELADGSTALAVFNKRPFRSFVEVDWKDLGYDPDDMVRDAWRQIDMGLTGKVRTFDVPRHGCMLFRIRKTLNP